MSFSGPVITVEDEARKIRTLSKLIHGLKRQVDPPRKCSTNAPRAAASHIATLLSRGSDDKNGMQGPPATVTSIISKDDIQLVAVTQNAETGSQPVAVHLEPSGTSLTALSAK